MRFLQLGSVNDNGDVVINTWNLTDGQHDEIGTYLRGMGIEIEKPDVSMITKADDVQAIGDFNSSLATVYERE